MKILMVIDNLPRGGRERRMIELLKGLLPEQGVEVELIIFSREIEYPEIWDLDMPIHIIERRPKKDPRGFIRLYRLARRFRPHIIHSWGIMSSIYAVPTVKRLGIKFVNGNIYDAPEHMHFFDQRLFRARLSFPFSDVILANSAAGLRAYHVRPDKGHHIHNGIDPHRLRNLHPTEEVKRKLGLSDGKLVGMVGAFAWRKDYVTYIEAAKLVTKQYPHVTFLAVGGGPDLAKIRSSVTAEYADSIVFTGQLTDVENVIDILDIGVLSTNSARHGEGISNSIMEYMAFEKPVVATDGGGTPEIVDDNVTGLLVPPYSPELMAQKILYLLNHPARCSEMGRRGKEKVQTQFTLDLMKTRYLELYASLL